MIEFRPAGSDVMEARVLDVAVYVFRLRGEASLVWRLTANALGVVGKSLETTEPEAAKIAALRAVHDAALEEVKRLAGVASACAVELEARSIETQERGPAPQKEDSK